MWGNLWIPIDSFNTKEEALKARSNLTGKSRIVWHKGKWLLKILSEDLLKAQIK